MCGMTLKAMRLGNFFVDQLLVGVDRLGLREQFVHAVLAGARHRLIGRDHHALDRRLVVQRLQRDDELRGRAVRIGDDVLLGEAGDRIGIHFRHDQRHVRIHAPGRGIVDHDRAGGADLRRPFLRHRAARRHQADVDVGEIVVLERFDLQGAVAIGDFDAHAAARGQRHDLVGRKFALGQNVEHLAPDIAGGADHCDLVTHRSLSGEKCLPAARGGKGRGSASMRETPLTQR